MKLVVGLVTGLLIAGTVGMASATPTQYSANGHYYEVVISTESTNWEQARTKAQESCFSGLNGYLATITSAEENAFVVSLLTLDESNWTNYWIGASQQPGEGEWSWITNESFTYTNWSIYEPNNGGMTGWGPQDSLVMYGYGAERDSVGEVKAGQWDDGWAEDGVDRWLHPGTPISYIVEYASSSPSPVPEPTTILLIGTGLVGFIGARRKKNK